MRILHVCESYPPHYGGGAAVYAADICQGLVRRGHEVRVLAVGGDGGDDYSLSSDVQAGISVRRVTLRTFATRDPEGWGLGLAGYRRHEERIDRLLRDEIQQWRPDIAHLHTTRAFGEQQFFSLRSAGIPMVAMAHEAWLICMRLMLLRSPGHTSCEGPAFPRCAACLYSHYDSTAAAIAKSPWRVFRQGLLPVYRLRRRERARRLPALVLAYSRFMAKTLENRVRAVRYIPLGVAHPASMPTRPARPHAPFRFGFFGGGQPMKGLPDVLRAMRWLGQRGVEAQLHVWGSDGERVLDLMAAQGSGDNVRFRGSYDTQSMWAAYAEVDCAVMATRMTEAFGRIPQEAALSGIPSIVPAVGGLPEQIRDGVDGLLFGFGDPSHLARQMERLVREPSLYPRLSSNLWSVRDTMEAVPEIEAAYHEALQEPGTAERAL